MGLLMFYMSFIVGLIFCIITGRMSIKRIRKQRLTKMNDLGANIYWIIVSITFFTFFGGTILVKDIFLVTNGDRYVAEVISFEAHSNSGRYNEGNSYTPIVKFKTEDSVELVRSVNKSILHLSNKGDFIMVYYHPKLKEVTIYGMWTVVSLILHSLLQVLIGYCFIVMISFALGWSMKRFKRIGIILLFGIVLPLSMLVIDAILIYGLFCGNRPNLVVRALCGFFTIMLTYLIYRYVRWLLEEYKDRNKRGDLRNS